MPLTDEERRERQRASKRRWNAAHREQANAARRAWNSANPGYQAERRRKHRQMLDAYKREQGCTDCGTQEGRLDFDHREGEEKLFELAHSKNRSWQTIMAEAAKCDVRCVSCHTRRHALAGDLAVP